MMRIVDNSLGSCQVALMKRTAAFLVPGLGKSRDVWRKVSSDLEERDIETVIWSESGMGEAGKHVRDVEEIAADLIRECSHRTRSGQRVIVVTHSFGVVVGALACSSRGMKSPAW